jgi:hypothetical protein
LRKRMDFFRFVFLIPKKSLVILSEILLWRSFLAKDNPKTIDDVAG